MSDPSIRLRYEQPTISPFSARLYLNDIEISDCVTTCTIRMNAGDLTECELIIRPDHIEIDTQTMLVLQSIVDANDTQLPTGETVREGGGDDRP